MTELVVNSDNSLQDAIGIIRELYVRNRYLKLNIKIGKDRSLPQNSILHLWIVGESSQPTVNSDLK